MSLFSLSATLSLDKKGFDKGVRDADKEGRGLAKKISAWTVAAGQMISTYATKAVDAVVGTAKKAIDLYGELEQQLGGVEVVFKNFNKNIVNASTTAYKTMGLSQAKFLAEANKMGSLLQGMGIAEDKAADMTINWMQRAADVASIMGISTESAMQAIEGAAKGNFTMMDNLGVAMNATTLEAYALEKGMNKTFSQMTQDEKIMLAYEMFMDKTAHATGNFTKENDTLAGGFAVLSAAWENLLAGVGDGTEVADAAAAAFDNIFATAQKLFPKIWSGVKKIVQRLWPKFTAFIGNIIKDLPKTLDSAIQKVAQGAIDIINGIFGTDLKLSDFKLPKVSDIVDKVKSWWKKYDIGGAISTTCDWVLGLFKAPDDPDRTTISQVLGKWWALASAAIQDFCGWVLGIFTGVAGTDENGRTPAQIVGDWFNNVVTDIVDACGWVLGLFGLPVDKDAKDAVSGFLQKNVATVGSLFKWAISLPDTPPETSANNLGKIVNGWLDGVLQFALDLTSWIIPIPGMPNEIKTASNIVSWWDNVKAAFQSLGDFVINFTFGVLGFDSFEQFIEYMKMALVVTGADILDAVGLAGLFNIDTEKIRQSAVESYKEAEERGFNAPEDNRPKDRRLDREKWLAHLDNNEWLQSQGAGLEGKDMIAFANFRRDLYNAETFFQALGTFAQYNNIIQKAGGRNTRGLMVDLNGFVIDDSSAKEATETVKETQEAVDKLNGSEATIKINVLGPSLYSALYGNGTNVAMNAKGLDYVPYDDYITRLHRGETVLSGNEARAWRESGGHGQGYGGAGAIVSAIQGLSNDMQNLRLYVGERAFAGAVVDYSGRRMDDYLGSSSTRKRRGYGRR